ncbi:hypothetical protein [Rudaeicoccus suwonensis]|uniref:hypothetical protein n=1 Tax=Rudaeicoccus suwonensis TaxID=657409 RepID=UPI0011A3A832|nr:hypothetical protein [Rudaeicoccus suwonensis]
MRDNDIRILTDDEGAPLGTIDVAEIDRRATLLAYRLATCSNDHDQVDDALAAELGQVGSEMFGFVAASALRMVVTSVLDPVLEVTDRLTEAGYLRADLRAGLADAYDNATATIGGDHIA